MTFPLRMALLSSLLVALLGCDSQPETPPREALLDQLPAASDFALTQAIELRELADLCSRMGPEMRELAETTEADWQQANWPALAAADNYFTEQAKGHTVNYRGQTLSLEALNFLANRLDNIQPLLERIERAQTRKVAMCERYLAPYGDGRKSLADHYRWGPAISLLVSDYGNGGSTPYRVPSLAGDIQPEQILGRSLFTVEQLLRARGCTTPKVVTLEDAWPREAYGGYCQNQGPYLYQCQWGDCQVVNTQ